MKFLNWLKNNFILITIFTLSVFLITYVINFYFTYYNIFSLLGQDFLDGFVESNRIIMEDAKARLVIYSVHKGKPFIIGRYPIEVALHYPENFHNKKVSLLVNILQTSFSACTKLSHATPCKLLVVNDKGGYDFLLGERLSGIYEKNIPFNFFYVIQYHYYERLFTIDKVWPPLKVMVDQIMYTKSLGNYKLFLKKTFDTKGDLLLKIVLDKKTLKIRTGTATVWTDVLEKKNRIYQFYSLNYRLKPMLALHYNDGLELYTIDIPMNQYYVDTFKKSTHNLQYLKKLFKIEVVAKRWVFQKEWLHKYDSYDRKYRRS